MWKLLEFSQVGTLPGRRPNRNSVRTPMNRRHSSDSTHHDRFCWLWQQTWWPNSSAAGICAAGGCHAGRTVRRCRCQLHSAGNRGFEILRRGDLNPLICDPLQAGRTSCWKRWGRGSLCSGAAPTLALWPQPPAVCDFFLKRVFLRHSQRVDQLLEEVGPGELPFQLHYQARCPPSWSRRLHARACSPRSEQRPQLTCMGGSRSDPAALSSQPAAHWSLQCAGHQLCFI